jgi:hypothetical protein
VVLPGGARVFVSSAADLRRFSIALDREETPLKMKMPTNIPANILTPDAVETRLGTLKFVGELHAAFRKESRTRGVCWSRVAGNPGTQDCAGRRDHSRRCGRRYIIVAAAGYFFAATYWTCTCSMVPLNLNGTLS